MFTFVDCLLYLIALNSWSSTLHDLHYQIQTLLNSRDSHFHLALVGGAGTYHLCFFINSIFSASGALGVVNETQNNCYSPVLFSYLRPPRQPSLFVFILYLIFWPIRFQIGFDTKDTTHHMNKYV